MLANPVRYFNDELVILWSEGCANIVGFRSFLCKSMKFVSQKHSSEEQYHIDWLVQKVRLEVKDIKCPSNYNLDKFAFTNTYDSTSQTLLNLVAQLVSNGKKDNVVLTLSSCIQQHIASSNNQVTLGLALKLHHKFGSAELVKLLHEHGLVESYDEVLLFRKSAAKYMCDHKKDVSEQVIGFCKLAGPLSGWCDNYDLLVCTPNGRRETHCLVMEFMCHPSEDNLTSTSNDENPPPFIIPQLKKSEARNLTLENSPSVTLLHYTGLKKVNPPMVSNNMSASFDDLFKLKEFNQSPIARYEMASFNYS